MRTQLVLVQLTAEFFLLSGTSYWTTGGYTVTYAVISTVQAKFQKYCQYCLFFMYVTNKNFEMKLQQGWVSEQHTAGIRYWMNLHFEQISLINDSVTVTCFVPFAV